MYKTIASVWQREFGKTEKVRYKLGYIRWLYLEKTLKQFRIKTILEFGCGLSTLLFSNAGCDVESYETDPEYIKKVFPLVQTGVMIMEWDNKYLNLGDDRFDMAFVDGILPRIPQIELAKEHSNIVVIDDYTRPIKIMKDWIRIDDGKRFIGVFVKGVNYEA